MDHRIAIWNVLHDGEITVAERTNECLTIWVTIPYIRERLRPLGDSFAVSLHGLRAICFSDYEGKTSTSEVKDIARSGIEILSTDSKSMPVKIATTMGFLELDFDRIELRLDTGREVTFEEIDRASFDYWEEWGRKAEKKKAAQPGATDNPGGA